jgi:hypothetical protein
MLVTHKGGKKTAIRTRKRGHLQNCLANPDGGCAKVFTTSFTTLLLASLLLALVLAWQNCLANAGGGCAKVFTASFTTSFTTCFTTSLNKVMIAS